MEVGAIVETAARRAASRLRVGSDYLMYNLHDPDQSGNNVRQPLGCRTPEAHAPSRVPSLWTGDPASLRRWS